MSVAEPFDGDDKKDLSAEEREIKQAEGADFIQRLPVSDLPLAEVMDLTVDHLSLSQQFTMTQMYRQIDRATTEQLRGMVKELIRQLAFKDNFIRAALKEGKIS